MPRTPDRLDTIGEWLAIVILAAAIITVTLLAAAETRCKERGGVLRPKLRSGYTCVQYIGGPTR